ncbi:histidinol phosphatase-like PHP family hydrolase [Methanomicrobium sp. W14]|uniref:PHP domain-containing protein n=1 Tax=Methanomicrobium sp. W14 TaxID=2817839 RepID=UPI001AEAA91B|nr:PHP-associated domain-containing protein [Methanomicrobium sp. W14]MBP2133059.1 histidinol phosphatase-like PHP family hydrolase [Methanomicrobium sp. W14]
MDSDEKYGPSKVIFGRPDFEDLKKSGATGVDMHFHTNHSDSHTRVKDALKLARSRGIGLSITDHNEIRGVIEAGKTDKSVLNVPGIEISAWDGPHILMYFFSVGDLTEYYKKIVERKKSKSPYLATKLNTEDIVEPSDDYNAVPVAAHPFGYLLFNKGLGKCIERDCMSPEIISRFSGLEVISGGMTRKLNIKAVKLASEKNLSMTGGTDGHLLHDLGNVLTCSYAEDAGEFLEEVIRKRNSVIGQENGLIRKGVMATAILPKYFRYTIPSLQIHYRQNIPRLKSFEEKTFGRKRQP